MSDDDTFDPRFDGMFLQVAEAKQGIAGLLDTYMSFLRRRTDFFDGNGGGVDVARAELLKAFERQAERHEHDVRVRAKKRERDEAERRERDAAAAAANAGDAAARVEQVDDETAALIEQQQRAAAAASADDASRPKGVLQDDAAEGTGVVPNAGNGGVGPDGTYVWTQTLGEVEVRVPVPDGTKSKQVDVVIGKRKLRVATKGADGRELAIDGLLTKDVKLDECVWTLEDRRCVVITLAKANDQEWWRAVVDGHAEINTQKVQPENSKLSDLDGETRATVEKMMFDSAQKQRGLPTSDQLEKQEMLKKFAAAHPELDLSQAKIN